MKFLILSLFTLNVFAATNTQLNLKANMPAINKIEISPAPSSTALPLGQTQTDLKVARGKLTSNSPTGVIITVQSKNQSNLKRVNGTELFPYTMKFGSTALNLTSPTALKFETSSKLNVEDDFKISYAGRALDTMAAGEYLDIITVTVSVR